MAIGPDPGVTGTMTAMGECVGGCAGGDDPTEARPYTLPAPPLGARQRICHSCPPAGNGVARPVGGGVNGGGEGGALSGWGGRPGLEAV